MTGCELLQKNVQRGNNKRGSDATLFSAVLARRAHEVMFGGKLMARQETCAKLPFVSTRWQSHEDLHRLLLCIPLVRLVLLTPE